MGTSSFGAPGIARAIEELGLIDKAFTSGTGMPADNAELLKSGVVFDAWDPAIAGKASGSAWRLKVPQRRADRRIGRPGADGYTAMTFREGKAPPSSRARGWVVIDAENVDSFGF